jgi:hypothetical protein
MSPLYSIVFVIALAFGFVKYIGQYDENEDEDSNPPVAEQVLIINTRDDKGNKWDDDPLDKGRKGPTGSDVKR